MSFCPLIRMPGTSLGPCMLVRRSYASSVVQRYKWTSPKETGRIRIGRQNNSGSEPEFVRVVAQQESGSELDFAERRRCYSALRGLTWHRTSLTSRASTDPPPCTRAMHRIVTCFQSQIG